MKKIAALFVICLLATVAECKTYISVLNGDWNTSTTWSPVGIPINTDTVTINTNVTINVGYAGASVLTINHGFTLTNNKGLTAMNGFTNNGSFAGSMRIAIYKNNATVSGTGSYSNFSSTIDFWGTNQVITSGTSITLKGNIILQTAGSGAPVSVINNGSVNLQNNGTIHNNGTKPTSWTQGPNSILQIDNGTLFLNNSFDTLNASGAGNEVIYSTTNCTIKKPSSGTFYHLILFSSGYTNTFPSDLTLLGELDNAQTIINFAGHNLTIGGPWLNNTNGIGKYLNMGTINFNGSSQQLIEGNNSTRFTNMTISGSGGVKLLNKTAFTGVLTLSGSGNLSANAGIVDTLVSTSTSTARVAQITGSGTITCSFVVQRYDGRNTAQYEALTTPVQSTTLGDWNTSNRNPKFYMSGVGGPDGNAGSYVSVYLYGETTNTYNPITNFSSPGINYTLVPGQGVYLWMGQDLTNATPYSFITHGVPNEGTIPYTITKTAGQGNGFNIIGNPYPSPIDWTSFSTDVANSSLQSTFYVFEQDNSWHTFTSGSIAMEQGFGVVTNAGTTLNFKESHKSAVDASLLRAVNSNGDPSTEENAATFKLSNDVNSSACSTIVTFGPDYTPDYYGKEDAIFIKSFVEEAPELYTLSNDKESLCLNRLPDNSNTLDVPLTAVAKVAGNYTLAATEISKLTSYAYVYLIDPATGAVLNDFKENPSYRYTIRVAGTQNNYILRFTNSVESTATVANNANDVSIYSVPEGAMVNFRLTQPEEATISVYTITGQKIMDDTRINAGNTSYVLNLPYNSQIYIIRVITANGITTKKLYH